MLKVEGIFLQTSSNLLPPGNIWKETAFQHFMKWNNFSLHLIFLFFYCFLKFQVTRQVKIQDSRSVFFFLLPGASIRKIMNVCVNILMKRRVLQDNQKTALWVFFLSPLSILCEVNAYLPPEFLGKPMIFLVTHRQWKLPSHFEAQIIVSFT